MLHFPLFPAVSWNILCRLFKSEFPKIGNWKRSPDYTGYVDRSINREPLSIPAFCVTVVYVTGHALIIQAHARSRSASAQSYSQIFITVLRIPRGDSWRPIEKRNGSWHHRLQMHIRDLSLPRRPRREIRMTAFGICMCTQSGRNESAVLESLQVILEGEGSVTNANVLDWE